MITSISQLIALVESNGDINALRFEPAYHPDPKGIFQARVTQPGLSFQTYETICSCSWGKYQIMGDNLFMLGLKQPIAEYWRDASLQDVFFNRFCCGRNIAYTLDEILNDDKKRLDFAHHYNGNTQGYSARIIKTYHDYQNRTYIVADGK